MATTKTKALEAQSQQRLASKEDLFAKRPRTKDVVVVLDAEAVADHDRLLDELKDARRAGSEAVGALEERVEGLRAKAVESERVMRFRGMGNRAWDALVAKHPPTEEDIEKAKEAGQLPPAWCQRTFLPAAIAHSLETPTLTEDEVQELLDEWNIGEGMALWSAALDVNTRRVDELGKGSG